MPFRGAEDIAVGSVTATPVEAGVLSMAVDAASMEAEPWADVVSVAGDVPTAVLDMPSMEDEAEVAAASVAVDVASVEADTLTAVADMEAVAVMVVEADMVVGTGRFASKSKLSRPTALAVGRWVER